MSRSAPRATPPTEPAEAPAQQGDPVSYEAARDELADVVGRLEAGGLSLEESLTLWERGEHLAAVCTRLLAGARSRVEDVLARAEAADED
ncbi:exodeoxyribonuclease VII small subunit [Nakamurella leprariae]|uniref:Exodeoxyribonuclease 7 small subunit n=1 Tax=Nakamurella leprariae TaxID=2803911 RepID=A0A938Y9G5_9ACTN|nr:exodeoxyribonuclease VII small subunit [Nakamurella leprariae]MBM9468315.1 exodeoxyribonuclease VII small subunit [Nakamurella leprariae]